MKNNMKGVILAGGLGTRMRPLTKITNKHLLPVYDKQMIMFPIETLSKSGIKDILIISDKQFIGDFSTLLGSGGEFGVNITYKTQDNPKGGIADAMRISQDFVGSDNFVVILGDNIFEDAITFDIKGNNSAKVFIKNMEDVKGFGVADIKEGKLINIIEKPDVPPSNFVVLGAYVYDSGVFSVVNGLKPSERGELEITDVNNYYAKMGKLDYQEVGGFWADAGTFEGLYNSSSWRKNKKAKQN